MLKEQWTATLSFLLKVIVNCNICSELYVGSDLINLSLDMRKSVASRKE